jgi:hypothetical protein
VLPWIWCVLPMVKVSYLVVRPLALKEVASGLAFVHPSGIIVTIGHVCRNCLLRSGLPSQPLHAVRPILLREVFERLSYSTDEHAERFVGNARRHKNHARVGSPLFGPLSEEGLEVAHVGGHQHPAFCEIQLKDRRAFHSFWHAFESRASTS